MTQNNIPTEVENNGVKIVDDWRIGFEGEFAMWWNYKSSVTERIEEYINLEKKKAVEEARRNWLREEIVKLEGMKVGDRPKDFHGDNDPQWWDECAKGHNSAIETIVDRYQSELDQPPTNQ